MPAHRPRPKAAPERGGPGQQFARGLLERGETVADQLVEGAQRGLALAEAMLAGCTPVVTPAGAIPEVAGSVGEYAAYGDVAATTAAIERAFASPRPQAARDRIATEFTLERRRLGIVQVVERLLGENVSNAATTSARNDFVMEEER